MTVVKWSKIVEDLTKDDRIPYLKGCFGNVDDIIYKKISAYQLDPLRLPYDPVHAEALLYDVGARLDRCVVYRREANELTITGIKAELDYQTYIDLRQIDDDLQKAQLRIAQSQSEERGYRSAAAHFGKVASPFAKLAAGFQDQALAIAESSKSTAYAEQFRSDLIAKRRAQLDGLTDKLYSRLGEPGSAHNYGDRWKRVIRLLGQDIRVAYEKARCAEIGLSTLYGLLNLRPLSSPWKADENAIHENVGFLDEFVLWVRDAIDTLETSRQQELEFELTIPFVGMYPDSRNGKRPPLFNRDEFRRIMTGSKRFVFKLKDGISVDIFDGLDSVRLQSVGLSFSNSWHSGDWDENNERGGHLWPLRSERRRQLQRFITTTAWVWPPAPEWKGHPFHYAPVFLGRVGNFESDGSPAMQACFGVDPRGEWAIELGDWAALPNDRMNNEEPSETYDIFHDKYKIWDLKLFLRVFARPYRVRGA